MDPHFLCCGLQHFNWQDYDADHTVAYNAVSASTELAHCSYRELLSRLTKIAASKGLLVVFACSRIRRSYKDGNPLDPEWPGSWDGLWYDSNPSFDEQRIENLVCLTPSSKPRLP